MPSAFDVAGVRADFPVLHQAVNGKPLVYFDNAASAQKPEAVLARMAAFASRDYANVHRGLHELSNRATAAYEAARAHTANFINAADDKSIIFTANATDAINLVAHSYCAPQIKEGDEIILSIMEHHSNIVPWHFLRERYGAVLKWIPITESGTLDMAAYEAAFTARTKMVAMTHMSNALGCITNAKQIVAIAHNHNVKVLLDGCQSIVHLPIDVQALDCDFYVFSAHKLYGPTGIGVLYGKADTLRTMRPYRGGGEMIASVSQDVIHYADIPERFEAGTPAIIEAVGLEAALTYLDGMDREAAHTHEMMLHDYAADLFAQIDKVRLLPTPNDIQEKGAILSFCVEDVHPHDIATLLDQSGVAMRAGQHCAEPLMAHFGVAATLRASFAFYNTREEVEQAATALDKAVSFFR